MKKKKGKKKTCIKVTRLEKPRKHNMRIFWDREIVISNVIEFGWNIDIFLNLFQHSTTQKRLKCCHFSYFRNLKIALFQAGVFQYNIIISSNRCSHRPVSDLWPPPSCLIVWKPEEFNSSCFNFWNVKTLYFKLNPCPWPVSFACGTDREIAHIVDRTCP